MNSSSIDIPVIQIHEKYMRRCLQLAGHGLGNVAPNPLVGCVIVHEGKIIGEGFHHEFGKAHAEVNAIASVSNKSLLKSSILYVNLEPCAHHGKTPPCADLIIDSKIPKVVIGTSDPFDKVDGKGIQKLRDNGVEVIEDVLKEESLFLNRRFFTYHEKKRPFVILKWAESVDGFTDRVRMNNVPGINWITGKETKQLVHLWRSQEQAVMVGTRTVVNDNPSLTVREVDGKNPIRIIIDRNLTLPRSSEVFNSKSKTVVINTQKTEELNDNLLLIQVKDQEDLTHEILHVLFELKILSAIVEGGSKTIMYFLQNGLWDEARVIRGNVKFEQGLKAPCISLTPNEQWMSNEDMVMIYYNEFK